MFEKFRRKRGIYDEIREFVAYQECMRLVEKGKNLEKLGRGKEAIPIFKAAEKIACDTAKKAPRSLKANLLAAIYYKEVGILDKAQEKLSEILSSKLFKLDEKDKLAIQADLYKINNELPIAKGGGSQKEAFSTIIYVCQSCGRIINFVTTPCSFCSWFPQNLSDFSRSVVLSNNYLSVPQLLFVARSMSDNKSATDVVGNLNDIARDYYQKPEDETRMRYMFDLLKKNSEKSFRDMDVVRACPSCGERLNFSEEDECKHCGEEIDWPDAIRLLVCIDNLMWLFEQRIEIPENKEFSEFILLLVAMFNQLLRDQEAPSEARRIRATLLLKQLKVIADKNRGAIVDMSNLDEMKIYLVKSDMDEDSKLYGYFIYSEISYFAKKMKDGIRL